MDAYDVKRALAINIGADIQSPTRHIEYVITAFKEHKWAQVKHATLEVIKVAVIAVFAVNLALNCYIQLLQALRPLFTLHPSLDKR